MLRNVKVGTVKKLDSKGLHLVLQFTNSHNKLNFEKTIFLNVSLKKMKIKVLLQTTIILNKTKNNNLYNLSTVILPT